MAQQPAEEGRRVTRQCVCGQKIILELRPNPGKGGAEDAMRVVALYSETGARIEQCPRCGTSIDK